MVGRPGNSASTVKVETTKRVIIVIPCRYKTSVLELAALSVFCAQQGARVYCYCCVRRV